MYKYEELKVGDSPLVDEKLFRSGDSSIIYRDGIYLYKIYTRRERFYRQKLDYLLDHQKQLEGVAVPPISKLKVDGSYGMKMKYLEGEDFYQYINRCTDFDSFVRVLIELSNRLKVINKMDIHFSDLHHHNILLQGEVPFYIDLDDSSIGDYGSTHISWISMHLHELKTKSYWYEDDLIKHGNLDRESLGVFLLDYLFKRAIEKYPYGDFQRVVSTLEHYVDSMLVDALSRLKNEECSLKTIYEDYVGDYLTPSNVEGLKRYQKERLKL